MHWIKEIDDKMTWRVFLGHMGVSKNRGTPKRMVNIMENPIKMDDLGVPLFLETPIYIQSTHPTQDAIVANEGL